MYDPEFSSDQCQSKNSSFDLGRNPLLEGEDFDYFQLNQIENSINSIHTEVSDMYLLDESHIHGNKNYDYNESYSILKLAKNL